MAFVFHDHPRYYRSVIGGGVTTSDLFRFRIHTESGLRKSKAPSGFRSATIGHSGQQKGRVPHRDAPFSNFLRCAWSRGCYWRIPAGMFAQELLSPVAPAV